jgi:hypothetical protein
MRFALTTVLLIALWSPILAHARSFYHHTHLIPVNIRVSHDSFGAHSEPAIAENPRNHKNMVAASKFFFDPPHYQFKIGYFYTLDGGHSWHDGGLLPGFDAYSQVSDVSLAFDRAGNVYACVLAVGKPGSGIFVLKSTDGGRTFGQPVAVYLDPTLKTFSDKPWIAVDTSSRPTQGNVYVVWNLDSNTAANDDQEVRSSTDAAPPTVQRLPESRPSPTLQSGPPNSQLDMQIVFARSTDGGHTFSAPLRISGPDQGRVLGAMPVVGPDGSITVIYTIFDKESATAIYAVHSTDAGLSFSAPVLAHAIVGLPYHLSNGTFRNFTLPDLAVDPVTGALYLVWSDYRMHQADVLFSRSTDGGQTWSVPLRVNDDPPHNGADHFMPAVAVARDGVITVSWFDRRRDPTDHLIDTYLAQSNNGGITFGRNRRVTTTNWDPAIDAPEPEGKPDDTFIGDYEALCADNRFAHPLWNSTQNGRTQEIYMANVRSIPAGTRG